MTAVGWFGLPPVAPRRRRWAWLASHVALFAVWVGLVGDFLPVSERASRS